MKLILSVSNGRFFKSNINILLQGGSCEFAPLKWLKQCKKIFN